MIISIKLVVKFGFRQILCLEELYLKTISKTPDISFHEETLKRSINKSSLNDFFVKMSIEESFLNIEESQKQHSLQETELLELRQQLHSDSKALQICSGFFDSLSKEHQKSFSFLEIQQKELLSYDNPLKE
jgi:hypothetical protein